MEKIIPSRSQNQIPNQNQSTDSKRQPYCTLQSASVLLAFCGCNCVLHQHGDGHRPYSTRYR
jgi:hypothetical protein